MLPLLLLATNTRAQTSRPLRIVTFYDSARTQRRAVYGAQLTGPRPDTVAHGPFRRFGRDGSLQELGHFTLGQADSIWTRYYPAKPGRAPAVARRLPMRAGQPSGPFVVFHPDGRVAQRGTFRRGQLVDSLVTTGRTGRSRLLARFDSSRAPGLRGSFRQWGGQYTAAFLPKINFWGDGASERNDYPRRDPARYWQGQLAAGRLVGAYTEYDPDGEPRVRLSYTDQGQYRLTTVYYPAAWLRSEAKEEQPLPADSVVHSQPFIQWQAVGPHPYLLQRHWSYSYGSIAGQSEDKLYRVVPLEFKWNRHHHNYHTTPRGVFTSDVIGTLRGGSSPAPLPPQVAAAFIKPISPQSDLFCSGLQAQYRTHGRPPLQTVALTDGSVLRRYPPLSRYRQPVGLEVVRHPGRWHLGAADTTGASPRPARQRTATLADGRRLVETRYTTRTYFATGQLQDFSRRRPLIGAVDKEYYPNGTRKEQLTAGWLGIFSRKWDEAGHLTSHNYESPFGDHPGKALRRTFKQWHPLRKARLKLRRFHPFRPVGRAIRKVFPRHDHHTPRPHKD
ncbi:hypothetical protein MTP16_08635 [Hymenobacter monticola]|uniref:Toxin-antitoxin system YwqK family antitoxin n=2 Tax=Hymenobacter monticola TaxID=1705399 RepID=A0ABY4BIE4_9BACT|nr:hypothetical protein [Hymenobacter monticola]UOE36385.1 hypothetical protein MTP16_08635 [Hymenobacter monticola]